MVITGKTRLYDRAAGHIDCGEKHEGILMDKIRYAIEKCDSLQGFMFLHSLGGGTGSGFGTYALESNLIHYYRSCR